MGGLIAFLAGILAIVLAFLTGKRSTTTKLKGEVTIQRERAELSQKVSENVVSLAKEQEAVRQEVDQAVRDISQAEVHRDTSAAIEVARRLAKIAEGLL